MNMGNKTTVMGFLLLGFSFHSKVQGVLFAVFLLIYIITLLGNLTIIALIAITPQLHTLMYFFLFNLSCIDIGSALVTVPRLLKDLLVERKYIAINECITQIFALIFLGGTEIILLTVMCYDLCVAICLPLNYTILMTRQVCMQLVALSWAIGFLYSFTHTFLVYRLPFCGYDVIDNFLCEIPSLLKLACADTFLNEIVLFSLTGSVGVITCVIIFMSYMHIIRVILKSPSVEGRRKVFSTCSSHLMVVFLMLGTGAGTHLKPFNHSLGQDKLASLFYTVCVPMLNPIIYSHRNEEVKKAWRKAIYQTISTHRDLQKE